MIASVVLTVVLAAPSREALVERWLRANPAHTVARLQARPRSLSAPNAASPDLPALARRELGIPGRYQLTNLPPLPVAEPWWARAWRWMVDRWLQLWHALFGRVRVGKAQAASIGDVLLVIVGLVLIFIVVRLISNLQIARSRSDSSYESLEDSPAPRALYKEACNAARRGDYGNAALLLFAATIAVLDRRGEVDVTSSATVGDLRRALRSRNGALVAPFDAIAATFAQKAYAERVIDEPQWDRARTAFVTLSQE